MTIDLVARRIERARLLAERYPASAEILCFCAELIEHQRRLAQDGRENAVAKEHLLGEVGPFLNWLERAAPAALAQRVPDLRQLGAADWRARFDGVFAEEASETSGLDAAAQFVAEALSQAFTPREAARSGMHDRPAGAAGKVSRCPSCGSLPVVGLLREEGHGTRRSLVCARCETEWPHPRLCCAGCGEDAFVSLPVFTAEQFPHVRIEACDSCRRYLKTVDLSRDGLADPVVDDVASLPLDLWARTEGYTRLQANLLRL